MFATFVFYYAPSIPGYKFSILRGIFQFPVFVINKLNWTEVLQDKNNPEVPDM